MADKEKDKSNETQAPGTNSPGKAAAADKFDPRWLEGKTFRATAAKKEKGEDGKTVTVRVPVSRPLTRDDLLDWKIVGAQVVMVTRDGRKYRMQR